MSAAQRVIAILVAVLVVVGVGVVLLIGGDGGVGQRPGTSDTPRPSGSPAASGSPAPSASADPDEAETLAILAEIEEQVVAIRGLEAADIGPADLITRAELGDELRLIFDEEYPPEERERDNIALRALGLLEPDQDVAELQLELLGSQVLGFYDDVAERMVVVSDAGLDANARLTYAHEYTHALQDAAFDLDSLETDAVGEDDRALARTALIEGDATVTMLAWAFEHLSQEELLEIGSQELPDVSGIPNWMVATVQFPYTAGLAWAQAQVGQPFDPDFDAIDEAYADPPVSTEQIIDLEAWQTSEAPDEVPAVDLASALGDGWEEVDATPIGQASIEIMLEYFGVGTGEAAAAAEGWGGDRAVVASGPDGAFAVSWLLSWDTAADGDEFLETYRQVIDALPFPAVVMEVGDDVLVAHASDEALLRQAVAAAGG